MASAPTLTDNKRIARQIPEAVATAGDLDLIDTICAVDLADHSPLGEIESRAEFREQMESIRGAFSDFSATVDDVVAEGDTVAMRVTLRGTHDGPFMGIEPTGNEFEVSNMVFTRIEDGKIAERWVLPDMLGMLQQVGAVDMPER
ncbi:ester cyclase [Halomicroarcula sp. GCM10025817]|uniref:ester cyclase n=1 Tax=Haloarcula TaxID=2237 RepID=UPI0023E76FE4|nr:ester cyclase [Halomicroarcula sp. SYNS111]